MTVHTTRPPSSQAYRFKKMTYNILKVLQLTCNLDEGNYKQLLVLGTHEIER